ncbi:MAG: zinc ribbon domain-containing protein [Bacteroidales bacterium]|nr:zinc ribbon domain-containing protein [Bacteroidales bacterium]
MRCPKCGWPNRPGETFCTKCGSPLESTFDNGANSDLTTTYLIPTENNEYTKIGFIEALTLSIKNAFNIKDGVATREEYWKGTLGLWGCLTVIMPTLLIIWGGSNLFVNQRDVSYIVLIGYEAAFYTFFFLLYTSLSIRRINNIKEKNNALRISFLVIITIECILLLLGAIISIWLSSKSATVFAPKDYEYEIIGGEKVRIITNGDDKDIDTVIMTFAGCIFFPFYIILHFLLRSFLLLPYFSVRRNQ